MAVNTIRHGLALQASKQILRSHNAHVYPGVQGLGTDMWQDDDVVQLQQRVIRRQWLRLGDIQGCPQDLLSL